MPVKAVPTGLASPKKKAKARAKKQPEKVEPLEEKEEPNSADQGPSQQRATQCALLSTLASPLPQNLIALCQSHIVSGTADRSSLGC